MPATALRAGVSAADFKRFVVDDYDAMGSGWESAMAPAFRVPAERLVKDLHPRPGDRCLDLACGSALVARAFARVVGPRSVAACDLSAAQVDGAKEVLAAEGLGAVEVAVMDAERLRYRPASFERVACAFAINHLPRPHLALGGVLRILAPGGRAGFTLWNRHVPEVRRRLDERLYDLVRLPQDAARERCESACEKSILRNSDPERIAGLMRRAGYVGVEVRRHRFTVDHGDAAGLVDMVLAREARLLREAGLDAAARARLRQDLVDGLAGYPPRAFRIRRGFVSVLGSRPLDRVTTPRRPGRHRMALEPRPSGT